MAVQNMQFGNFLLERRIGSGGMGVVYLGRDIALNRQVAVKLLTPELAQDATFVETFLREAEITASLSHPNVVDVYAFGQEKGYYYLVMELIEGGSLDDRITKLGPMPELEVIEVGIGIARGLECANNRGLVHRDIKPGNILFGIDCIPKVVDFGLCRPVTSTENATGEIWGSADYIAPEKLDLQMEDFRSDLYSLGITLFHAIAGRVPYNDPDVKTVFERHLSGNVISLKEVVPWVDGGLAKTIKKSMSRYPSDRHESYKHFVAELEDARRHILISRRKKRREVMLKKDERPFLKPAYTDLQLNIIVALIILFCFLLGLAGLVTVYRFVYGY